MNNTYFNYDNNPNNNTGNDNYTSIETPSVNPFGAKLEDNGSFNNTVPQQPTSFNQPVQPVQQPPFNPIQNQPQQFNPLGNQVQPQPQQFNPLGNNTPNQYNNYQEPQKEIIPGGIPDYNIKDDQLIDAYMGPEAQKFKNSNFNVGAFFFGIYYFAFRKMYLEVGIILLIDIALVIAKLSPGALILGLIFGFAFNSLYYSHAQRAVQKIKEENRGASMQQLQEICAAKGGTSLIGFLVLFFLSTILPFIIIFTFVFMNART